MTFRTGNHDFSQIPSAEIQRSSFNRSHGFKTTLNAGDLVPIFCDEVLPGDTFNLSLQHFARLATPLKPFMDNLFFDTFYFFVPYRLVWQNWQRFNGEQDKPTDSIAFTLPQVTAPASTGWAVGSLGDYLGLPTGITGFSVQSLPFRAYNLIWNQWFRDENLQDSVNVRLGDTGDLPSDYSVLKRGKRHDYFTSCLPWPQKGSAVSISLGSAATVKLSSTLNVPQYIVDANSHNRVTSNNSLATQAGTGQFAYPAGGTNFCNLDPNGTLYADLATASPITINALRQAFQLQKLAERDARGGTRYTEIVRSHFGVVSPDARLQRPEYLGGGSAPINCNPVAQTTPTPSGGTTTPQGNLAAFAVTSGRSGFVKSFTEHGIILGLASVRADLNYQQGLNRMWSRSTRYDFYWPALAHLGEQAVLNKEIYLQATSADNDVFGYQERYAEYRYKPSLITGQFRSTYSTPLDMWHLAQRFTGLPTLSSTFIQENPPISRVIAVPSEPQFLLDCHFNLVCARPMPVFGVPGLIDHF